MCVCVCVRVFLLSSIIWCILAFRTPCPNKCRVAVYVGGSFGANECVSARAFSRHAISYRRGDLLDALCFARIRLCQVSSGCWVYFSQTQLGAPTNFSLIPFRVQIIQLITVLIRKTIPVENVYYCLRLYWKISWPWDAWSQDAYCNRNWY